MARTKSKSRYSVDNTRTSHRSDEAVYLCANLLMDSLKLVDDSVMTDKHIIDIMYNVKCLANGIEHFPVNPLVDQGKEMEIEDFLTEWKRLFKFEQCNMIARGHLFTVLVSLVKLDVQQLIL